MQPLESQTVTIENRFHGPPNSANGGYVCGRLAAFVDGPATVRLMRPPPLDLAMTVHPIDSAKHSGTVELRSLSQGGEGAVARAWPGGPDLQPPAPPSWDEAVSASKRFAGFSRHAYPTCFVCGPDREAGDGLCVFAGPVENASVPTLVAAPWQPDVSLADDDTGDQDEGRIADEFLWSALDCPGAFTFATERPMLLGELAAEIQGAARVGERLIVTGWETAAEGRKHFVGTAVHREDGKLVALARGTWFEM